MACECARLTDKPTSQQITNQSCIGTAACTATGPLHDLAATLLGLAAPSADHITRLPAPTPPPVRHNLLLPVVAPPMCSPPVMGTTMVASANCTASWDTPDFSLPSTNAVGCVQSQSWATAAQAIHMHSLGHLRHAMCVCVCVCACWYATYTLRQLLACAQPTCPRMLQQVAWKGAQTIVLLQAPHHGMLQQLPFSMGNTTACSCTGIRKCCAATVLCQMPRRAACRGANPAGAIPSPNPCCIPAHL